MYIELNYLEACPLFIWTQWLSMTAVTSNQTELNPTVLLKKFKALAGTSRGRQNDEKKTQRNPAIRWPGGEAVSVTQETRPWLKTRCVRVTDEERGAVFKTGGELEHRERERKKGKNQLQSWTEFLFLNPLLTCRLSLFLRFRSIGPKVWNGNKRPALLPFDCYRLSVARITSSYVTAPGWFKPVSWLLQFY